jgi:hypothetical protein
MVASQQAGRRAAGRLRPSTIRLAALLAACAVLAGSCQAGGSPSGAAADRPAVAQGRWERIDSPPRSSRGLQWTEAVRGAGKVVIVGGVDYDQSEVTAVVRDPSSGRWSPAARSRLWWRFGYSAIAVGGEVILWGGCCGPGGRGSRASGAVYDIARDEWRHVHPGPLVNRFHHTAVWTGQEMIVWGGSDGHRLRNDGAAYQPRSGRWRKIAGAPLPARRYHVAVWTGSEMIVWGGSTRLAGERESTLPDARRLQPQARQLAAHSVRSVSLSPGADPWRGPGARFGRRLDRAWDGDLERRAGRHLSAAQQ